MYTKYDYLIEFLNYYKYSKEASEYLVNSCKIIFEEQNEEFNNIINSYDKDGNIFELTEKAEVIAEKLKINKYTMNLLVYIFLSIRLKEYYIEMNYPLEIYYDSMEDLKYKNDECKDYYNVYGTCVPYWFVAFFALKRFKIGILEFEYRKVNKEYIDKNITITKDKYVIDIHIPKTGQKLEHQKVLFAYKKADSFFKKYFSEYSGIYYCSSWLLFNQLDNYLSPDSNIIQFKNDFVIFENNLFKDYQESMRIFNKIFDGNIDKLPSNTKIQRAYIDMIKKEIPIGYGVGAFNIKDLIE